MEANRVPIIQNLSKKDSNYQLSNESYRLLTEQILEKASDSMQSYAYLEID